MPVYNFTYHSYRSWNANHPRGFVQTGRGIQPPNERLAKYYDRVARSEPTLFGCRHQALMTWIVWDTCARRNWRLHAVAFEPTHVHFLVSWQSGEDWRQVRGKLKNLMSWALSQAYEAPGHRWFVRKASRKRVRDHAHFEYLITRYFPRHRGRCWTEGDGEPQLPAASRKKLLKPPASAGG
jgi:REP element-mobilizing transposase RayT